MPAQRASSRPPHPPNRQAPTHRHAQMRRSFVHHLASRTPSRSTLRPRSATLRRTAVDKVRVSGYAHRETAPRGYRDARSHLGKPYAGTQLRYSLCTAALAPRAVTRAAPGRSQSPRRRCLSHPRRHRKQAGAAPLTKRPQPGSAWTRQLSRLAGKPAARRAP